MTYKATVRSKLVSLDTIGLFIWACRWRVLSVAEGDGSKQQRWPRSAGLAAKEGVGRRRSANRARAGEKIR